MTSAPPRSDAETAVDRRQVLLILGAHWRVLFSQTGWRLAVGIVVNVMFAAFVAGVSAAAFLAGVWLRRSATHGDLAAPLVHAASHFVFLSLVASPVLGLRGNEFLDVTKLFTLPVNHRTVFAASILGLLASHTVAVVALPYVAFVAGVSGGAAAAMAAAAAAACVVVAGVAAGQALYFLFLGVFSSRKWRDLSRVLAALSVAGFYIAMQSLRADAVTRGFAPAVRSFDGWKDMLVPLPSWWGAHAIAAEGALRWLPALLLPALVVWLVRISARLQERAFFSEIEERRPARPDAPAAARRGIAAGLASRLRGVLGGLVEKDVRLLLREPSVRIQVLQQFAFSVVPMALALLQSRGGRSPAALFAWVAYVPVLASFGLSMNLIGTEGPGIQHVLLTPAPRRSIVLAKLLSLWGVVGSSLAAFAALAVTAIAIAAAGEAAGPAALRGLLAGLEAFAAFGVFAAIGAVTGTLFPLPVTVRDRRALRQATTGRTGCLRTLLYFASLGGGAAACGPVFLAFHHPMFTKGESSPLLAVTIPLALGYAALLAWLGTRAGGAILADREEQVMAVLAKPQE